MKKLLLITFTAFSMITQAQIVQNMANNDDTIAVLTFPNFKNPQEFKPTTYAAYTGTDTLVKVTVKYKTKKIVGNTNADTIITIVKDSVKIPNRKKIRYFYESFNAAQTIYSINPGLSNSFNVFENTADNLNSVLAASSNYPSGVVNTKADNWILIGPIKVPAKSIAFKFLYGFTNDTKRDGFEIRTIEASKLDATPNYTFIPKYGNYGKYDSLSLSNFSTNNTLWDSANFVNNTYNTFKQATLMSAPIAKDLADIAYYEDNDTRLAAPAVTPVKPYTFAFDKALMYPRQITLTAYRGLDIYVAIHHLGNQQDIVFFDDLLFKEANSAAPNGLNSLSNTDNVIVYPNPANDVLNIIGANSAQITIVNMLGEVVKSIATITTASTTVNIADLASGMYIVNIKNDTEVITKKIIKN